MIEKYFCWDSGSQLLMQRISADSFRCDINLDCEFLIKVVDGFVMNFQ